MSFERTLVVRDIPAGWTEDDIELFFDNDLHCPDGRVEKVELTADAGTHTAVATVTFEHAHGNNSADCISLHF